MQELNENQETTYEGQAILSDGRQHQGQRCLETREPWRRALVSAGLLLADGVRRVVRRDRVDVLHVLPKRIL